MVERGGTTGLLGRNPWVARRPLTVSEYHRMGEAGILPPDERTELIEGEIILMAPIGSRHMACVTGLAEWFFTHLAGRRS